MNRKNKTLSASTEQEFEYTAQGICLTLMCTRPDVPTAKPRASSSDHFHRHTWFELFYTERGERTLYFEEERLHLRGGGFALVAPDALHYAEDSDTLWQWVCSFSVQYHAKGEAEARLSSFLQFSPYRVFGADEFCSLLMRNLLSALALGNGDAAGSYLFSLLLRAADLCAVEEKRGTASPDSQIGRIHRIEQSLYSQYTDEIPLASIAEHLHLSERQLSRVFKKQYGLGYRAKKRELRMQSAARRLLRGEEIPKIAQEVGYSSISAFYSAFKRYFGVSPAVYKQQRGRNKAEGR